ncbi:MAG TPA: universal stress protein [Gemmatimonadales bacterium]|nr:universal stress protein [Gemmatimonadales bacterium]
MSWKPVIVGVDASPAAVGAAAFAARLAQAAETRCQLVHAIPETWTALAAAQVPYHVEEVRRELLDSARRELSQALRGAVPDGLIAALWLRFGRAPLVLRDVARELDAELVVLGGKRHSLLGRWFGGSTAHNAIRTLEVPVLVTRGGPGPVRRVLAAVDLSGAAVPTLEAAQRYAKLFDADLRVVTVLEPLPAVPQLPTPDLSAYAALFEEHVRREVWSSIRHPKAETVLRHGTPAAALSDEAAEWSADLLVVGSHGKGWAERALIGSVTERLLDRLPTSLLVVPTARAPAAKAEAPPRRNAAPAAATG